MVIFDTENYKNMPAKGMLYLNLMDVDYILKKYGIDNLKKDIPEDYIDYMVEQLDIIDASDVLDMSYYGVLNMGIETEEDEKLLELLRSEVQDGNLLPKNKINKLKEDELNKLIEESFNIDELSEEELYKLRSYQMAKYVLKSLKKAKEIELRGYEDGYFEYNKYNMIVSNLRNMGLDGSIKDSNYFDVDVNRMNHNN
jgi:hypothetical protein